MKNKKDYWKWIRCKNMDIIKGIEYDIINGRNIWDKYKVKWGDRNEWRTIKVTS